MNLKQVKNALFQTECAGCVRDGMCCSEPVMTRDARGIIDNYFIYGENSERKSYSGPLVSFGVYSEQKKTAYIDCGQQRKFSKSAVDEIRAVCWDRYDEAAYSRYQAAFPQVREFLFEKDCTREQKEILQIYIKSLRSLTDDALWPLYRELAPDFFTWARACLGR